MSEQLPKWPKWEDNPWKHDFENEIDYHQARADAAMARLLGAVKIARAYHGRQTSVRQCAQQLEAWLSAIGEIPEG